MKKLFPIIAGLFLLLAFSHCSKPTEEEIKQEQTSETVEFIDENIQSQLDALSDKSTSEVLASLNEWIKTQEGIGATSVFSDHVEITYVDGSKGSIEIIDPTIISASDIKLSPIPVVRRSKGDVIGNQKAFIYDAFPHLSPIINPGDSIEKILKTNGYEFTHLREAECTIDAIKQMTQYGYVQFVTHGNIDNLATGEQVTDDNWGAHLIDRIQGRVKVANMVIKRENDYTYYGDFFCVTDKFISNLKNKFDNSIIFNGGCLGFTDTPLLRDAFISAGAATYFGFDNSVKADFAGAVSTTILSALLNGYTVGEAFDIVCGIEQCHDYVKYDDILGNCSYDYTTCIQMKGSRDIKWHEKPPFPTGAVNSLFTVNANGDRVYFSKGNLQYQASTNTWRFAEHQYDLEGTNNSYVSPSYSGWLDLFCWGTSGWNSGAQEYQPYSTSASAQSYLPGGSTEISLTGDYANADWAYYNSISNGGQRPGLWRCLTHEEYIYMMEQRANANEKYGYACVNGTNGLIILPDLWVLPQDLSFVPLASAWNTNTYTAEQWELMEAAGAIFLPATGTRQGTRVFYVGGLGDYWSSTVCDPSTGHSMSFFNGKVYPGDCRYRFLGTSVRPVTVNFY